LSCSVTFSIARKTKNPIRIGIGRTPEKILLVLRSFPIQPFFLISWRNHGVIAASRTGGPGVSA
jgi:hypothetical protein